MGVSVPQYEHGVVARLRLTHGEERDDHLVSKPVVVSSRKLEVRSKELEVRSKELEVRSKK